MIIRTMVLYRARCQHGVTLYNSSFKSLIRGAIREMRGEYGHQRYYSHGVCHIEYGVLTDVYHGNKIKSGFVKLRDVCTIAVSSIDTKTYTYIVKGDQLI